jgi:predicted transcriptional regulator
LDIEKESHNYNDSVNQVILDLLKEKPNLKARSIASILGIDKNIISKALWNELKDQVVQDNQYRLNQIEYCCVN